MTPVYKNTILNIPMFIKLQNIERKLYDIIQLPLGRLALARKCQKCKQNKEKMSHIFITE